MTTTRSGTGRRPADVGPHCELSAAARALLDQHATPESYLQALRESGSQVDALSFLAHWLPKREAVWWGCLCVWHMSRPELAEASRAALAAVVRWVQEPIEPRRRAIERLTETAGGTHSVCGCLAYAAMFSGGSLTPEGLPVVPPAPYLTAYTLANMFVLAAAQVDPLRPTWLYAQFLDLGLEVLHGKHHWDKK